jgi:peroxiredoxin Q/BCP
MALLAWMGGCGGGEGRAAEPLKAGDAAPSFELPGSDGKTYKLSSFKGKQVVVLAWFPKAFTGGCTKECQSFGAHSAALREFEMAYFMASCDPVEGAKGNRAFAQSLAADFPILSDVEKSVAQAYGVVTAERNVPLRWTFYIGKDGKILYIDKDVNTGNHGADVAAKLKELGVAAKRR